MSNQRKGSGTEKYCKRKGYAEEEKERKRRRKELEEERKGKGKGKGKKDERKRKERVRKEEEGKGLYMVWGYFLNKRVLLILPIACAQLGAKTGIAFGGVHRYTVFGALSNSRHNISSIPEF